MNKSSSQVPRCYYGTGSHEYSFGCNLACAKERAEPSRVPIEFNKEKGYHELHGCIYCGHQKYVKVPPHE